MRDMFYNYDHNINKKEYPRPICNCDCNSLTNYGGAQMLKNKLGKAYGVRGKANSAFDLFFYIDGRIDDTGVLSMIDADKFTLEILSKEEKVITTVSGERFALDTLKFTVNATDDILPYGIYRINLKMEYEDETYILFSTRDAILSIM